MKLIFCLPFLFASVFTCYQNPDNLHATDANAPGDSIRKNESLAFKNSFTEYGYSPLKKATTDTSLQIGFYIRQMLQDKQGNLWFGTFGRGLARYDGKKTYYFSEKDGIGSIVVRDIKQDSKDAIWIATDRGLFSYINGRFKKYSAGKETTSNEIWSILVDDKIASGTSGLWIGTENGAFTFDGKTFKSFPLPSANLKRYPDAYQAPKLVNSIIKDRSGKIWFATNGGGIYAYNPAIKSDPKAALVHYSVKEGLSDDVVQGTYLDKKGQLWFTTRFGGVSRFDGNSFTNLSTKNKLSSNFVWSVYEDSKGHYWFATAGGGVVRFDGKDYVVFTTKDGLLDNYVQTILEDHDGNLWFGTGTGLCRFDGKKFISHQGQSDGC